MVLSKLKCKRCGWCCKIKHPQKLETTNTDCIHLVRNNVPPGFEEYTEDEKWEYCPEWSLEIGPPREVDYWGQRLGK